MDLDLAGRHVLVTGASKGIGLAIATAFAAEGARLTLVARREDVLKERAGDIARKHNAECDWIAADLSQDEGRAQVFEAHPDIDILVNNAGAIKRGPLAAMSMEEWRTGFDLKVWGYIHLCKLYVPQMQARGLGTVINIIGMGGRATRPGYIIGAAGNAALIGFTQALGTETPDTGVRVFGINPSSTLTDRMEDLLRQEATQQLGDESRWQELIRPETYPFGRPKSPEEVAALSVMLASPRVEYLSGTVIDMDGGGRFR